jgi:propionyl-CoA synthetase
VHDHWWQTETGWPVTAPASGWMAERRAGSSNRAVPGYHVQVLDDEGRLLGPNETGSIVISLPLPPGCARPCGTTTSVTCRPTCAPSRYYHTGDGGYWTRMASSTSWAAPTM